MSNNMDDLNVIKKRGLFNTGTLNGAIFSILFVFLGFFLAKYPDSALRTVCYIIGGITLLYGLIKIIIFFINKEKGISVYFDLTGGLISSAIGIFLLLSPNVVISIIPIIVGIIILFHSIVKIRQALDLSKVNYEKWWIMLIIAFVTAVLGVLIILNPVRAASAPIRLIGIIFIIDGLVSLFGYIFTDSIVHKLTKETTDTTQE